MKASVQYKCKIIRCYDNIWYDYELVVRYKSFINNTHINGRIYKNFWAHDDTALFLDGDSDEEVRQFLEEGIKESIKEKYMKKKINEKNKAQEISLYERFNKRFSKWTSCEIEVDLDES